MYSIEVKGLISSVDYFDPSLDKDIELKDLSVVDGISCHECFSEYLDSDEIGDITPDISGGYMEFKVIDNKLYVIVEYNSKSELNEDELHDLKEYTLGQMSDGIGEGFEQQPCSTTDEGYDIYISPYNGKIEYTIIQKIVNE